MFKEFSIYIYISLGYINFEMESFKKPPKKRVFHEKKDISIGLKQAMIEFMHLCVLFSTV